MKRRLRNLKNQLKSFHLWNPEARGCHLRSSYSYQLSLHFQRLPRSLVLENQHSEPFPPGDRHEIHMSDILSGLYNSWWSISNSFSFSNSKKLFLEYRWKKVILYLFFIYFKKGYTSWKCAYELWLVVNNFNTLHNVFF